MDTVKLVLVVRFLFIVTSTFKSRCCANSGASISPSKVLILDSPCLVTTSRCQQDWWGLSRRSFSGSHTRGCCCFSNFLCCIVYIVLCLKQSEFPSSVFGFLQLSEGGIGSERFQHLRVLNEDEDKYFCGYGVMPSRGFED